MNDMFLGRIGTLVLVSLAAYLAYFTLKSIFLYKININRWIVFTAALVVLFIPRFIGGSLPSVYSYIISGIFVILLLWLFDLNRDNNKRIKSNDVVVKSKKESNNIAYGKKRK